MLSVDAILFDLDGTLIDSKKDIALSVHHVQQKYDRPLSPDDEIARFIGDGVGKLIERAIGKREESVMNEAVELFKIHYREHALDNTYVYPGVLEILEHFKMKKLGVLTNKPVRISKHILDRLGLGAYFGIVLGGDSGIRKKPDPEGVHVALQELGIVPTPAVVIVGDSYQDVLAGRSAGIRTCGITSNIGDPQKLRESKPDYFVNSLHELARLFQ